MASRSATVLVIFIVAVMAFCFAGVFAAMTGPINIFPNETGGVLDNLSAITDSPDGGYDTYGSQDIQDYSTSDDSQSSDSQQASDSQNQQNQHSDNSGSGGHGSDSGSSDQHTSDSSGGPDSNPGNGGPEGS